jgi:hypothetical protein
VPLRDEERLLLAAFGTLTAVLAAGGLLGIGLAVRRACGVCLWSWCKTTTGTLPNGTTGGEAGNL